MDGAFDLAMPWWQFVLRAVVVYAVLLVLIRLSGKRTMGQFTPFDMLLIVLLGNAVQNALLGKDTSLAGGVLLATTLIALNWVLGFVTARSRRAERMIEGEPVVLARNGTLYERALKRELVSRADFHEAMREQGCTDIAEVKLALLETNGQINIMAKD
ncbi:membrane protein [Lysobacter daejeonensis GH1-9]|uniref:Membrane protein n=1 Tax=Lysobacter daejeonensis GH1-9 TaxID=1385517 RepID=A0A0A0EVR0_9GAMM|nr:YetF domain-containing protein [Lysobacter daejeonensis]KGM54208.1 membrane protein [Lysobacter daejeonensis GH1-9]